MIKNLAVTCSILAHIILKICFLERQARPPMLIGLALLQVVALHTSSAVHDNPSQICISTKASSYEGRPISFDWYG